MESRGLFERILTTFSIVFIAYSTIFRNDSNFPAQGLPAATGTGAKINNTTDCGTQVSLDGNSQHPQMQKYDYIYSNGNTGPIVNEEYKVIFFHVAKAASSEWIRFFTRLSGNPAWCGKNIHKKEVNKLKWLSDYSLEEAQSLMIDPSYTKAIFVRNPKPRLLSAFLDKAVAHSKAFETDFCIAYQNNGGDLDDCIEHHKEFDFFIYNITTVSWKNVHWRPIYTRIDEKWWPYINYIANMENLSYDASHFLQSINSTIDGVSAWDRIGKSGWSDNERDCNTMGDSAFLEEKDTRHKTDAVEKLKKFYTPELERFVEKQYEKDYNNPYFHFTPMTLFPENN